MALLSEPVRMSRLASITITVDSRALWGEESQSLGCGRQGCHLLRCALLASPSSGTERSPWLLVHRALRVGWSWGPDDGCGVLRVLWSHA